MKLNPDCIRDILLAIEKTSDFDNVFYLDDENYDSLVPGYDFNTVMYHLRQCDLYGYLYNSSISCTGSCSVVDLTPKAHEFINNIRKDTNWNKTKEVAGKVGSFSLNVLSQIATNVITSLINSYTGLT